MFVILIQTEQLVDDMALVKKPFANPNIIFKSNSLMSVVQVGLHDDLM